MARRWEDVRAEVAPLIARYTDAIGNDGLTDAERAEHAARFLDGVGKTPTPSPERTARLAAALYKEID